MGAVKISDLIVDPKWLIYLPPTMSPPESTNLPGYLEHPTEALAYYRKHGVSQVICEQKHMGSRLVAVICRDEQVARQRFGIQDEGSGIFYSRTGRRFLVIRMWGSAYRAASISPGELRLPPPPLPEPSPDCLARGPPIAQ